MKEEQEQLLRYIGELYHKRRLEKREGKYSETDSPEHDEIVKAGKRIRKIREKKGMSIDELASLTDLTPTYVAGIEIGEADPYMTEIYDITKVLGVELSSIFDKK